MNSIQFTVLGEPYGKGRPRFNRFTGTAHTPEKTECKIFIESFSTTFQFLPTSLPALCSNKGGVSLNTVHLVESKAIPIFLPL